MFLCTYPPALEILFQAATGRMETGSISAEAGIRAPTWWGRLIV